MTAGENTGLKIEAGVAFTEGPAWHAPTKSVFFTDIVNNRIMRRDAKGALHIYRTPSMHANGLAFDKQNRLIAIAKEELQIVFVGLLVPKKMVRLPF